MIEFKELRVTPDGKTLIIDVAVKDLSYYDNVYIEIDDGCIFLIQIHLYGDIRCGYSDYFVLKMEDFESFFELENWIQSKMINDRYSAYIDLMSETYSVYDHEKQENVGDFYEREVEDLLNQINEDN